ncbi:hypothetical protein C0Q59_18910 [Streptomyces albidoflavus]|uniref:hypothetical protein n=1 Tax=Streptomyces albidoflavus TaxID=1886 RepID=UPI0010213557|nr:hypothetical protein [Streptomyces albidoflavus]RZD59193.1 hypothetical protein C0Q59_18910 [Streptomyces albidoflavus]
MTPPIREWRRRPATRLLLATLATTLTAASFALAFLLVRGEDLGPSFAPWQEITGTLLLAAYATLCAAMSRARLTLDSRTLTVRNLRETAIPLEEIERVEFRHGFMAIHTTTGDLHRSLALDGADFPRFWRTPSRGREAKRAILRAIARRHEETTA